MPNFLQQFQLRKASSIGNFSKDAYLPWRYGRTSGACIRLNANGTRWLWADHVVQGIDSVLIDGAAALSYRVETVALANSAPYTVVALAEPQDANVTVFASGRGKMDAMTGELITNPADLAFDVLRNLAKLELKPDFLTAWKNFAGENLLTAAGSITEPQTAQAFCRELAESFGTTFNAVGGFVVDRSPAYDVRLDRVSKLDFAFTESASIEAEFDFFDKEPSRTVVYGINELPQRSVRMRWCKDPSTASRIAKQLFEVGPKTGSVRFGADDFLMVGARVRLKVPRLEVDAVAKVIEVEQLDREFDYRATFQLSEPLKGAVLRSSIRFDSLAKSSTSVKRVGENIELEILDQENGQPLAGAKCTLNSAITRFTDAAGIVLFPQSALKPSGNSVLVESAGRPSFELSI